jgi:hypothetical protein
MLTSGFGRDANRVPITTDGVVATTSHTFADNAGTIVNPIFTIVGSIEVRGIWGVVTTALGSNHTAAYLRINDQTATPAITLATGVTLSSEAAGSTFVKNGLAAAALVLISNSAGRVNEPTTLETTFFSPFTIIKKTAALTQIEYVYTTNQSPTTGAIQFFLRWLPLSADADVIAL